jgi:ATP-dependent Clp protease ATP-binding subunit ClpA
MLTKDFKTGLSRIYADAGAEATRRGDRVIGTDHLLLAMLSEPDSTTARALGVSLSQARAAVQSLDDLALASVGITASDLGRGALPAGTRGRLRLTPTAAVAFAGLRKSARDDRPAVTHMLLKLLDNRRPDPAAQLLDALGVDRNQVRDRLRGAR